MLARGKAMRQTSSRALAAAVLFGLAACSSTRPQNVTVLRYQHVANAHQLRFGAPVTLAPSYPVGYVMPLDSQGFWAIFVLCSINVTGSRLGSFRYDADRFEVEYGGHTYGPLQPYTLRLQDSSDLNTPADTASIVSAMAAEIQEGPARRVFARGYYPGLNYRIAVYVPKELPGYAGDELTLRYPGQPTVLIGNGHPPSDLPAVGGNGAGVASRCLP
jgi:hypothetical protein